MTKRRIYIYDTTLRDGGQTSSVSFTVEDKLRLITELENFGMDYIEAGWPGANDIDTAVFERHLAKSSLSSAFTQINSKKVIPNGKLKDSIRSNVQKQSAFQSKITAFGMTKKYGTSNENDFILSGLVNSGAGHFCIVGKTWDFHVKEALGITNAQNLEIIYDSVKFLVGKGEVIFDAEHFFDAFKADQKYAISCLDAAQKAGASWVTLCDTNGGSLPSEVFEIVSFVTKNLPKVNIGIHTHNDTECAVANSIAAVEAGANMVQGTINGLGERCGNANLCSVIPNLMLKLNYDCGIDTKTLSVLPILSKTLNSIINAEHQSNMPYVGSSAFAHKGGLHASAVLKNPKCYEHIDPSLVGNKRFVLISNQSGKSNVAIFLKQNNMEQEKYTKHIDVLTKQIKDLESKGYSFENSDASFELFIKRITGNLTDPFKVLKYETSITNESVQTTQNSLCKSTVLVQVGKDKIECSEESNGPVNSLDKSIRTAISKNFPEISKISLTDYKVRIIQDNKNIGTKSCTRINITSSDGNSEWHTTGFGINIIEASLTAIVDSIVYFLQKNNMSN